MAHIGGRAMPVEAKKRVQEMLGKGIRHSTIKRAIQKEFKVKVLEESVKCMPPKYWRCEPV